MDRKEFSGANVKINQLAWQKAGLTWTATGYGAKIPTEYMVWNGKRWQRVYCAICSNNGTLYTVSKGQKTVVDLDTRHALSQLDRIQAL